MDSLTQKKALVTAGTITCVGISFYMGNKMLNEGLPHMQFIRAQYKSTKMDFFYRLIQYMFANTVILPFVFMFHTKSVWESKRGKHIETPKYVSFCFFWWLLNVASYAYIDYKHGGGKNPNENNEKQQ